MNLSKVEKIIIMVLVVGGILALGIIFLCKPAYESIGKAENNLTRAQTEYNELMIKLERLNTIDEDIKVSKEAIAELEDEFYPDLTTYEAVEVLLAHLKKFDLKTYSVNVTPLATRPLNLEYYVETPVIYDLKTYSQNAKEAKEDEVVLMEGQFTDKDKVYTVNVSSLANVSITDENNEVIEPANYTETMKAAHKEAVCKFAANSQLTQIVSSMDVTFDVEGKYKDYLDLIDYLQNYERATYIGTVDIPVTFTVSPDEDGKYYTESGEEVKVDAGVTGEVAVDYLDDDILESKTISVTFFGVEQVEEIENLEINGVKIITNQNQ